MQPELPAAPLRRPKILLVENSLHVTGAFMAALAMVDAMCASYDVEMVLSTRSTLKPMVEAKGVVCHQLPMVEIGRSWSKLLRYIPQLLINTFSLRKLLLVQGVDILIINDYYNLLGAAAKLTGWRGRLMTIVRLMPFNQHRHLNRVWSQFAVKCSNNVIAVSEAVKRQLPKSAKVQVIYNPSQFDHKYPDRIEESPRDGTVVCLYLANYILGKGQAYALEAFSLAHAANPALRLRFVGSDMGLEKNRMLRLELQERATELGLAQVVSFHGFAEDVEKEIKSADIALNFSESESFSHTCLEACAYGRPIIATRCGGPEEIIQEGVSGLLVPVKDVPAMAEAMLLLSRDGELRQSMGRMGKLLVSERFCEKNFLASFNKICVVKTEKLVHEL